MQEVGRHRRELVIVAELDFGNTDGVVLVDDGQRAVLEQGHDRVAGVEVAWPAVEIRCREQDLGGRDGVGREALLVELHERRLADGRARLEVRQVGGPAGQLELADPRANRPGSHQRDLPAALPQAGDLIGERLHTAAVERPRGVG